MRDAVLAKALTVYGSGEQARDFVWKPEISREEGVKRLISWVKENRRLF